MPCNVGGTVTPLFDPRQTFVEYGLLVDSPGTSLRQVAGLCQASSPPLDLVRLRDAVTAPPATAPQPFTNAPRLAASHCSKFISAGLSLRVASTLRGARKAVSKSRLNWNMLPRSSAPGKPNPR